MLDGLMTGADRDLVKVWEKKNSDRFRKVMLRTKTVSAEATAAGISVSFEGANAPAQPQVYDMVLVAVGRSPNGKAIEAEKAGVAVSDRGFIAVDKQMRRICRMSLRSAILSASRCLRTRLCMRRTWLPKRRLARIAHSSRAKFRRSLTPTPKSLGQDSPKSNARRKG